MLASRMAAASIGPTIGNGDEAIARSSTSAGSMPRRSWLGSRRRRDKPTACQARPNGNTPPEGERIARIGGAVTQAHARRTAGSAIQALPSKHRRLAHTRRIPSVCTTPQAMRLSGWRTAGTITIGAPPRMARHGSRGSVGSGSCAGARSIARRNTCVPRPVSGMILTCDIPANGFRVVRELQ